MSIKKVSLIFSCLLGLSLCSHSFAEDSHLQTIKDYEEFRVAVKNDVRILSMQDERSGEYKGIEPTIANMIAKEIGEDVEVTFITITSANRESILDSGYADCMIGTYTISDDRKLRYDISSPYFESNVSILVRKNSNINSVADLVGKKIGIIKNSNSAKELVKYMISKGLIEDSQYDEWSFKPELWSDKIGFECYESNQAVLTAMERNYVQAFCCDKVILSSFTGDNLKLLSEEFSPQRYGIVTRQGSDLSPFIDALIRKWHDDGTLEKLVSENLGK
ncbi:MAG: transporter substrate-binding domain-containing protein [Succinivibrio dextrinosolvens]|nr:transporter substrate-binding domain-containing protein [Succinivibrio dextrinosolvens]